MKDGMFEKKDWIIYTLCIIVIVVISVLCGCSTTKHINESVRNSNSYYIGRIETTIQEFDREIEESVRQSGTITDRLERVDYLFGQYEQAVRNLRDEVDNLREQIKDKDKNNNSGNNSNSSSHIRIRNTDGVDEQRN